MTSPHPTDNPIRPIDIWQAYSAAQDEIAKLRAELAVRGSQQMTTSAQALADELVHEASTYAAGTPTRRLLHKAADALRSLPQPSEAAREALEGMVANFRPFTNKPVGAPNSNARFEQDSQIAAYRAATAALSVPASASEGAPVAWTIPGDDTADSNGFIPAKVSREGEFTKPLYAALPAAKAVGDDLRVTARHLVDLVWQHCSESTAVPSTKTADMLIDKCIWPASPDARGAVIEPTADLIEIGAKAIYIARSGKTPSLRISQDTCDKHFAWYHAGKNDPDSCVHYSNVALSLNEAKACLSAALQPATPATGGQHG